MKASERIINLFKLRGATMLGATIVTVKSLRVVSLDAGNQIPIYIR